MLTKFSTAVIIILFIFAVLQLFFVPKTQKSLLPASTSPSSSQQFTACTDHDASYWHPPVKKDKNGKVICVYGHEHGDATPDWVTKAHFKVSYDHHGGFHANTSDFENVQKHPGMKGFSANIKGVDVYLRIHLASNPLDRSVRYHSYELFAKDQDAGITHFQGWLDTGDPIVARIPYSDSTFGDKGKDTGRRPIVWAVTKHACEVDKTWCIELWTIKTSSWGPEIIWGINDPTTYFNPKETYEIDTSKWEKTGKLGGDRSFGFTFLKTGKSGKIWATQFGEIVKGPDDKKCSDMTTKYGVVYHNICLENNIANTLPQITRVGNTATKKYDTTGVVLPN